MVEMRGGVGVSGGLASLGEDADGAGVLGVEGLRRRNFFAQQTENGLAATGLDGGFRARLDAALLSLKFVFGDAKCHLSDHRWCCLSLALWPGSLFHHLEGCGVVEYPPFFGGREAPEAVLRHRAQVRDCCQFFVCQSHHASGIPLIDGQELPFLGEATKTAPLEPE